MSRNEARHLVAVTMVTILLSTGTPTNATELNPNITILCPETSTGRHCSHVKSPTGSRLELSCHVSTVHDAMPITWHYHNGTDVNSLHTDRMYYYNSTSTASTLVIDDVGMDDSGNYSCNAAHADLSTQIHIEAYVMPDYFVSGMVLLGINLALCLLFVICLTSSIIKQRRDRQRHKLASYETERD